jgi:hypothetical protein
MLSSRTVCRFSSCFLAFLSSETYKCCPLHLVLGIQNPQYDIISFNCEIVYSRY